MQRFRDASSTVALLIGSIGGFLVGGYLGLVTERGILGLITVVGAVGGAGVGTYLAQLVVGAGPDDEQ